MPIKPFDVHYSMTAAGSIYDEEAMTALELAGRTAKKVGETVDAFNTLEKETGEHLEAQDREIAERTAAQDAAIEKMVSETMPETVAADVQAHIDNGDFDAAINEYAGDLTGRVENLLGKIAPGGTTSSMDAEVIDARVTIDGFTHANLGEAVRSIDRNTREQIDGLTIEHYEKAPLWVDMKEKAVKTTDKFFSDQDTTVDVAGWNFYRLNVAPGERFKISGYTVQHARLISFLNSSMNPIKYYPEAASSAGDTLALDITVPASAAVMIVNERNHDDYAKTSIEKLTSYQFKSDGSELDGVRIDGYVKGVNYENVKDQAVKTEGAFMRMPDSKTAESAQWNYYTLPVTGGEKYRIKGYTVSAGALVGFLDGWSNQIFGIVPAVQSTGEILDETVTVPDEAVTMIVNERVDYFVVSIEKLDGQKFYPVNPTSGDILAGKKLIACGDSITDGYNPDGGYFKNYAETVAERHHMEYVKDGESGSTMANIADDSFSRTRYLNHTDFDYLTMWFGWNDNAYAELGTIDDTDDTTFYGAYNKVLTHYLTTYPTKKIGIIVPWCANTAIQDAVRAISRKYGVPCLDLADGNKCSVVWRTDNPAVLARRAALTYDGLHPNQAGFDFIAPMYEQFLLSL